MNFVLIEFWNYTFLLQYLFTTRKTILYNSAVGVEGERICSICPSPRSQNAQIFGIAIAVGHKIVVYELFYVSINSLFLWKNKWWWWLWRKIRETNSNPIRFISKKKKNYESCCRQISDRIVAQCAGSILKYNQSYLNK